MKELVNPLLWLLVALAGCWWGLGKRDAVSGRGIRVTLLAAFVLGWALSTPLVHQFLNVMLDPPISGMQSIKPEYLFVLAGGWRPGMAPEEDFLEEETHRRVQHAIQVWRLNQDAKLVLSGDAGHFGRARHTGRQVELMAEMTRRWRVPAGAIVLEGRSVNTFEHPVEASKLPGVKSGTPIGLVTSAWHMRRAYGQFCRYFESIALYPVSPKAQADGWRAFVPGAGSLRDNSVLLQELIGLAWYAVRASFNDSTPAPRCRR